MELGQEAAHRITPAAIDAMREAIREAGGREVFFAGELDAGAMVQSVRVCARGHEGAVPAFLHPLEPREVVIHNHPGGNIAPSEADLGLATMFGFEGHGVYIVDNDVERVYVVVEPFVDKEKVRVEAEELDRFLAPNSKLASILPGFEVRPQQTQMMETAAKAFNENGIAVIEAPTGVGKTVAYLLPSIIWALRNSERVVVSTNTINLQEQIIEKDIPLLAKCIKDKFSAVLVKGRGNYLCQRKLRRVLSESELIGDGQNDDVFRAIGEWAEKTEDGTLSDLPFVPPKGVWERVCSEADTCKLSNCPDPKRCFIGRARRDIAKADILVVNHHMLFADLAVKKEMGNFSAPAVLPVYKRLILDEAHNIEDSATEYFGIRVTRLGALNTLGRFLRMERGRERGLLPYLKLRLMKDRRLGRADQDALFDLMDNNLLPSLAASREALLTAFGVVRELTAEHCGQVGRDIKWRLTDDVLQDPELRDIHTIYILPAAEELINCAKYAKALARKLRAVCKGWGDDEPPYQTEIFELEGYGQRLENLAKTLPAATAEDAESPMADTDPTKRAETVRWIEIDGKNENIVRLVRCPLHVGPALAGWVYANLDSIVMTSATLSVRRQFDYLFSRIGLDLVRDRPLETVMIDSPFDFEEQAVLGITTEISLPNERTFLEESVDYVREALTITKGHAFVLFTSFYALDYAFRRLEAELRAVGITPLKQGSAARTHLLDRFRSDPASVLFGTDSFWEGVDVAGEALQCVILPKLPFRVPTEPVLEARAEAIQKRGGNPFMQYTVPQAVIKFRQGFGRLIRRKSDSGAILVLDKRIVTKHYGRVFLESLPGIRVVKGPRKGVMLALQRFFKRSDP